MTVFFLFSAIGQVSNDHTVSQTSNSLWTKPSVVEDEVPFLSGPGDSASKVKRCTQQLMTLVPEEHWELGSSCQILMNSWPSVSVFEARTEPTATHGAKGMKCCKRVLHSLISDRLTSGFRGTVLFSTEPLYWMPVFVRAPSTLYYGGGQEQLVRNTPLQMQIAQWWQHCLGQHRTSLG